MSYLLIQMITSRRRKAANSIWSKYDGIFFPRGLDEEFCQMPCQIFLRAMGGGGTPTDSPTFKISMREYEDMAIKVGDKITIEIKKSDSSSGR